MAWTVVKPLLYVVGFLVFAHGLYRVLRRFEPVRKVVVSYHLLAVVLAVLLFAALAPEKLGLYLPDSLAEGGTPELSRVGKVLIGAVVFIAALFVLRLTDLLVVGQLLGKRFGVQISVIARHLAVVILLTATVLLMLAAYDVQITTLIATSAVGSAIIGLALQDVLGNVIGGVALQAERPFQVGDWVRIGDLEGRVIEMNWRATRLATLDDDHLILPNSSVARERIRNFNAPTSVEARRVRVGVEYGVAPSVVKSVLIQAAQGAYGVLERPAPKVRLINYGDFAITYEIKFWIDRFEERDDIEDGVMTRVWYLLRRNEITIPFPIRDVYQHDVVRAAPRRGLCPGSKEVTDILRGVELLQPLDEHVLNGLSGRLRVALYAAGEVLMRQNDPGDSFVIIAGGTVSVRVNDVEVATLRDRCHFGEMSLLTGQPRSATVIALTDTETLIINRDCFESVLKANPGVAERLSRVLERIHAENLAKMQARGVADPKDKPTSALSILKLVKNFFGIPG
jgi:small-conductance mechanosensitive channel/CRP-like cAMP-binding protein